MKLIQLTDLHIGKEGEDTHGVDVRQNFLGLLKAIKISKPDRLILTGDLCFRDGDAEIYQWIKSHLGSLGIPYDLIPGNHDDAKLMAEAFGMADSLIENQWFFKKKIGEKPCFFLDTSKDLISESQLAWLENELSSFDRESVIFIHHPPVKSGVPYMDNNYALNNMEALQKVLFAYPNRIHLFCGHYHVDKIISQKNITAYITPSCFFQIDRHKPDFKIDHYRIGFREIEFKNGSIFTSVHYLEGYKLNRTQIP